MDRPTPVTALTYKPEKKRGSIRRASIASISGDRRASVNFLTGLPPGGPRLTTEYVWKPGEANPKGKDRNYVKNVIDGKSLYAVRRENIASREMQFISRPPTMHGDESVKNVEHLIEKNYILGSRLTNATPEKFPKVIMRRFNRVSSSDEGVSYGMPRPPTRTVFQRVMDGIKREPTTVQIPQVPSLHDPVRCNTFDEFCEVLGPSACQSCIENTNRYIGEQLQDMVFPMIDITTDKLIAPKLARLLKHGHKLQIRKRKLRELGIDNNDTQYNPMHQRGHPLSASTCHKCQRPYKTTKLVVTSPGRVSSNLYKSKRTRDDRF